MKETLNQIASNLVNVQTPRVSPAQPGNKVQDLRQGGGPDGKESPRGAQPDPRQVDQAVTDLNNYVQSVGRDLQFSVDAESGHTVITVLDAQTKDVIRQIPPEQVLTLAKHLQQEDKLDSTGLQVEA